MSKQAIVAKGQGATTNNNKDSLVKVVVQHGSGKWKSPKQNQVFYIDENTLFPEITFEIETTASDIFEWSWGITWNASVSGLKEGGNRGRVVRKFSEKKAFTQASKQWLANLDGKSLGGVLSVQVKSKEETFKCAVRVLGKNPSKEAVIAYLSTLKNVEGFDKLLEQESGCKHFINSDGEPIVSFDGGYGIAQATNPAPDYLQVWNWKKHIDFSAKIYQSKQSEAKSYLSKNNRTYTNEQLKLETWSRWNGGNYHVWDEKGKTWIRDPKILADTSTGNIGWDMSKEENKGKSEAELHERDKDEYKNPSKSSKHSWKYSGVCYADHVAK